MNELETTFIFDELEETEATNEENDGGGMFDFSFLGNVADAIPQITAQFNKGYQANQLAIAQAQAQAAEAEAVAANAKPKSNMFIWGGVILLILIVIILMFRGSSK